MLGTAGVITTLVSSLNTSMSKKKKNRTVGEAEGDWEVPEPEQVDTHTSVWIEDDEGVVVEPGIPDEDVDWGLPEQDTPVEDPEPVEPPPPEGIPPPPPECDSCHRLVIGNRYLYNDIPLCPECYNLVVKQHLPRSKW